jgi:hypothetical protein
MSKPVRPPLPPFGDSSPSPPQNTPAFPEASPTLSGTVPSQKLTEVPMPFPSISGGLPEAIPQSAPESLPFPFALPRDTGGGATLPVRFDAVEEQLESLMKQSKCILQSLNRLEAVVTRLSQIAQSRAKGPATDAVPPVDSPLDAAVTTWQRALEKGKA